YPPTEGRNGGPAQSSRGSVLDRLAVAEVARGGVEHPLMRVVTARVMALRRWLISRLPAGAGLRVHAYKAYYLTEPEIRWAVSKVKAGDLVVDVGCNIGVYAFWLAKRVGKSGKVIALDPAPACVQYLRAAALQLGFDQLTVVDRGASDTRAVLELHIPIEQN